MTVTKLEIVETVELTKIIENAREQFELEGRNLDNEFAEYRELNTAYVHTMMWENAAFKALSKHMPNERR